MNRRHTKFDRLTHNPLEQNEGNVCGRLLVLVMEAENLQTSSETGKIHVELRSGLLDPHARTRTNFTSKGFPASPLFFYFILY